MDDLKSSLDALPDELAKYPILFLGGGKERACVRSYVERFHARVRSGKRSAPWTRSIVCPDWASRDASVKDTPPVRCKYRGTTLDATCSRDNPRHAPNWVGDRKQRGCFPGTLDEERRMNESKLAAMGVAMVASLGLATTAPGQAPAPQPPRDSPQQMVDALHSAFGVHHARAVHAKGVLLSGTFTPSAEARQLAARDRCSPAVTLPMHGAVLRFHGHSRYPGYDWRRQSARPRRSSSSCPAARAMDIVTHSFNGFPTATAR